MNCVLLGAQLARMPCAEPPRRGSARALGQSTPCQTWMFIHISCALLSTVPRSSPAELYLAFFHQLWEMQPVRQRAPHLPCSLVGLSSEHPGAAAASGHTPPPSVRSLFRTRYSSPSGNPFELLNCFCLLPSNGRDAWSVSSVKGFLSIKF